jgi:hypothetical protein
VSKNIFEMTWRRGLFKIAPGLGWADENALGWGRQAALVLLIFCGGVLSSGVGSSGVILGVVGLIWAARRRKRETGAGCVEAMNAVSATAFAANYNALG